MRRTDLTSTLNDVVLIVTWLVYMAFEIDWKIYTVMFHNKSVKAVFRCSRFARAGGKHVLTLYLVFIRFTVYIITIILLILLL